MYAKNALRFLQTLFVALFVLTAALPGVARADEPAKQPTVEERLDAGAAVVVGWMAAVLFYSILQSSDEAEGEAVTLVDEDSVSDVIKKLTDQGFDTETASLTVVVPADLVSEADLPALQAQLEQRFVPTAPRGIRRLTVVRQEGAKVIRVSGVAGGLPLIVLWLAGGAIFFTLRFRFINFRAFRHAIDVVRGIYDDPNSHAKGEVSHFQALASALSATVGLGNIAGVAIAVAIGGPGAVFWIMLAGLLGMSAKFNEITLAMQFRQVDSEGAISGGPMWYLQKGLEERGMPRVGKFLGVSFALLCIGGSLGGGNTFQVNQSLALLKEQFPAVANYGWLYGLFMVILTAVVILGGIQRIAATAEKIVPVMALVYLAMCFIVIGANFPAVPAAAMRIVMEAFTPAAGYGGLIGVLVTGVRRAVFSNEAGVGSAAIAHSAVKTDHPVREGIVSLLEPFVDTVVICAVTGITIVVTGAFEDPANKDLLLAGSGSGLTARAVGSVSSAFPYVLTFAGFLFAYSTMISWSYYGERCFTYLFGSGSSIFYKLLFLLFVFLGSVVSSGNVLTFGDLMILSMAIPNILGGIILHGSVAKELDVYWTDLKAGKFKRFVVE